MATLKSVLEDWSEGDAKRSSLFVQYPGVVLRWMNQAQLRYCDKSEVLQEIWSPTLTSTGTSALPSDFLREIKDRVKWSDTVYLSQIAYPTANLVQSFSDTQFYSIWEGAFWVWEAAAGSPEIPYIKKPATLTTIATDDLEIPTEYHHNLLLYMDAMLARRDGNYAESKNILRVFDQQAYEDGMVFRQRRDPVPMMRSSLF